MSLTETSKFIALILRHKPEAIGIALDEHGWANVEQLLQGVNKTHPLTMQQLKQIVATDSKQRYVFNQDKTLIRANQGHSVQVDVQLKEATPPAVLYHGTAEKYVSSINEMGLIAKSRLYVHLSTDYNTAVKVGSRHGTPVVFTVDTACMVALGCKFYISENGVWLTKSVPVQFLTQVDNAQ